MAVFEQRIRKSFSKSASSYDTLTDLHRSLANEFLAQKALDIKAGALLDVGCGTGYLTGLLQHKFPGALVTGVDFAPGMLAAARRKNARIDWVLADARRLPFEDGSFDLVASNLAYQWVPDLAEAFAEARRVLKAGGIFACTLFGYHTCHELFDSLSQTRPENFKFQRLPNQAQVSKSLACFNLAQVHAERQTLEFKDMMGLIVWIKSIGANHAMMHGFLGPQRLNKAASIYKERFFSPRGIKATFEIIHVYAQN